MQIREANDFDIHGILEVLKASLGEISSKKTESVWRYKHIDNPFGKSLVLIAEEQGEIIGVRAFMRWQWQKGEQVYSALRAVDTATHPQHQGKGIFKKLTLKALEIAKDRNDHFVFNTPNQQSKPGYLKMGWKEIDKLKIQLRPLNFLKMGNKNIDYNAYGNPKDCEELLNFSFEKNKNSNHIFTPKQIDYLIWRYVNNPMQSYNVIFNPNFFIAAYIKRRKKFNEFRISEIIVRDKDIEKAKSTILKMAKESGAGFLSISPLSEVKFKFGLSGKFGPVLTEKNINLGEKAQQELLDLSQWNYSLGDLELF